MRRITVSIPDELYERIAVAAKDEQRSFSNMLVKILLLWRRVK